MKCDKCKSRMERLEVNERDFYVESDDFSKKSIMVKYACHKCRIYYDVEYNKMKLKHKVK